MPHTSRARISRNFTPNHPRREFDARLRAYTAAGRAALATGAAFGATSVVNGQVANLTAGSFTGPVSVSLSSLPATNAARSNHTASASQYAYIKINPFSFGGEHPAFGIGVVQKNYNRKISAGPTHTGSKQAYGNAKLDGAYPIGTHTVSIRLTSAESIMQKLGVGAPVKAGAHWYGEGRAFITDGSNYNSPNYPVGQNVQGAFGSGYAGFRVKKSANNYYYGWVRIQVGKDGNGRPVSISLVAQDGIYGAYNATPGGLITAGETAAVPEPASAAAGLALFALGAVGVKEFRRRRKAAERDAVKA